MISTCGSIQTSSNENDNKIATLRKVRTWDGTGTLACCSVVLDLAGLVFYKFCQSGEGRIGIAFRNSQEHSDPGNMILLLPLLH